LASRTIRFDCRTTPAIPSADAEHILRGTARKETTSLTQHPSTYSTSSIPSPGSEPLFYTMDNLIDVATQYALPAATAAVGAMYLNAKFHITKDLNDWRTKRKFGGIVAEGAKAMGDYYTLYHALELNDQTKDAFWFEGQSWNFADVRREADKLAQWFIDQGIQTKGTLLFHC
jgi:hypothetical protein